MDRRTFLTRGALVTVPLVAGCSGQGATMAGHRPTTSTATETPTPTPIPDDDGGGY
ncbi:MULTISPECIES: hypothetical protein [Haloarcula]|uniref:hypothetical protein n=1 Tax=Haloarcula TaxID=2237 RepID=UPI0016693DC7|nr:MULTISPECIES: hypothetical protein [Halomicroarcula]MBX0348729.1 hypothetical protein [Halomicroarcula pellucida]MDS0278497.1 hypothetical protein [Halomicroarcula sp. S1AR25-4]